MDIKEFEVLVILLQSTSVNSRQNVRRWLHDVQSRNGGGKDNPVDML
jgi:hypothetical protein